MQYYFLIKSEFFSNSTYYEFFSTVYGGASDILSSIYSRIGAIAFSIFGYKNETSSARNLATSRVQPNPTIPLITSAFENDDH